MSLGHALYYPHINLTNKNWLKHALLFWDKISRIVPSSVEPSDSEEIIKIKYETGFIEDYHPTSYDTSDTFNDFSKELERIVRTDRFFMDRYHDDEAPRFRYPRHRLERENLFPDLLRSFGTYIHVSKLDPRFKEFFFLLGVAIPGENEWEDWIKIDNEIGLLYMTFFAKSISRRNSLPIVTDIDQSFSAALHFESKLFSDFKSQFEYHLGNLVIQVVVPKDINSISIDKLLEMRNKYDVERTAFFKEISDLSNSILEIDNGTALKDALNQHSKLIIRETQNLAKLYNSHKIETVNKFLSISLPTTIASFTEYVPDPFKPLVATGGILFGLVSAANAVKKEKLELKANPKSYLLNIKSELSGDGIFRKINDAMKGIRKW